jgi:glutamine synthetase
MSKNKTYFLEYIWVDAVCGLRSKNRVLTFEEELSVDVIPNWNYDGSSTGQAKTNASEIILKPVQLYKDPFFLEPNSFLVLCETYNVDGTPHATNTRHIANQVFKKYSEQVPWYGIEQEFFLVSRENGRPLGFPTHYLHFPKQQGTYYCGVGGECVFGRNFVTDCYKKCMYAGLTISGMNGEVAPGQWEIQVGPCEGINAGDQLNILRYILKRTSELYDDISVDFSAKPVCGQEWNGSGGHTNFSTKKMREPNGLEEIYRAIEKLGLKHKNHIAVYGKDNHLRLTGSCETSDMEKFTYGVGSRSASIRIPTETNKNKCGYLEDRRPSSSCDFYLVTSILLKTIME